MDSCSYSYIRTSSQHPHPAFKPGEQEPESTPSLVLTPDGLEYLSLLADARSPSATMMFCTTFLSTPADELVCEGGVERAKGGGRSSPTGMVPGQALGPGGCLSTLRCLVLPQEELCQSLAYCHGDGPRGNSVLGKRMLLEVNRATSFGGGDDRGGGGCGARKQRSRSVSPAMGRRPVSPARDWFKGMVARGRWTLHPTFCMAPPGS